MDCPDFELFALETNRDHSSFLRLDPNTAFQTLLLTMMATPFLLRDSCFDCVEHNKLWKILKEIGIPDHLTCLLRNLYAGQDTKNGTAMKEFHKIHWDGHVHTAIFKMDNQ